MIKKLSLRNMNLSIQLLGILTFTLSLGHFIPEYLAAIFYSISLTLNSLLMFLIPIIIFSHLVSSLLSFENKNAIFLVLILFALVFFSNYCATLISYVVGNTTLNYFCNPSNIILVKGLLPFWEFNLPRWLPNEYALGFGLGIGLFFYFFPNSKAHQICACLKRYVDFFLVRLFTPLIPLFAFGFILKMQHDGILKQVVESYLSLILVISLTDFIYLVTIFFLVSGFNLNECKKYLKNVLPAVLTGFSTISSLATMPVTLQAAEKNTNNSNIVRMIIPSTVNIHMVGLGIGVPLLAFSILKNFNYELPSFELYFKFAFYFVLTQFSAVATPGSTILIILPLLESYFGFTSDMLALITTLYILFDPIETSANVLGNSALAILVSKIFNNRYKKIKMFLFKYSRKRKQEVD